MPDYEEFTGHTPGPWYVMEEGFRKNAKIPTVYSPGDELRFICECRDSLNIIPTDNLANARLIAAAPRLLAERDELRAEVERLREALEKASTLRYQHSPEVQLAIFAIIDAALAAKGE